MKLNIVQPQSARVTLPVRLCVRPQDLSAFQARTLSYKKFTDAGVDFGPDDFANDSERLAARSLANTLIQESSLKSTGWTDPSAGSLIPGFIAIEVAFPFDELAIQESIKDVVRLAGVQMDVAVRVLGHLEAYAQQTYERLSAQVAEVCRRYAQPIAAFQAIRSATTYGGLENLNENQLVSLVDELLALPDQLPSLSDLEALLSKSVSKYPAPGASVCFDIRDERLFGTFTMNDSAPLRANCNPPKATIEVVVLPEDILRSNHWEVVVRASIVGSFIPKFSESKTFKIDLLPLLGIHQEIDDYFPEQDYQAMDAADKASLLVRLSERKNSSDSMLAAIGNALSRIANKRNLAEASEWIAAHGSEALKLGSDLNYSMVRQYRLERAQFVLAGLLGEITGWEIALCKDLDSFHFPNKKASPSERALRAATAILPVAPDTTIYYAERISNTLQPEDGEYLKIEEGQLFPGAPAYVLFWPAPHAVPKGLPATSKSRKPRRKPV